MDSLGPDSILSAAMQDRDLGIGAGASLPAPAIGSFKLADVVPWGRCRAEYLSFFDLLALQPGPRILDVGAGPSSFNAEMTALGHRIVSVDPLYAYAKPVIEGRIQVTREAVMEGVRAASNRFVWDEVGSPEALEAMRLSAMALFLEDFEAGLEEGRYLAAGLPALPFAPGTFDIALCSHLLFTYSDQRDRAFHTRAVLELARVAAEVRVFPLLDLEGRTSAHLPAVRAALAEAGRPCTVETVGYEFQRGGNQMLRVTSANAGG